MTTQSKPQTATKTIWALDPAHSEINFQVKHLMISKVKGEFQSFTTDVVSLGSDFTTASIGVDIDTTSINTNSIDRDAHLKSGDFFDAERFPTMSFRGTSFLPVKDDHYILKGILTIKGISHEVAFDVEFGGISKDPWGQEKAGFSVTGKINRTDWGLNWNAALETGGVLVSEDVRIMAEIQLVKQA